jgi:hypothetical protein
LPDIQYDDLIHGKLERDGYAVVRRIASSLGIAPSSVWRRSTQELGMKSFRFRWVTRLDPDADQGRTRLELSKPLLTLLRPAE